MAMVKCVLCEERLESSAYDNHMAWKHPDFNPSWSHTPPRPETENEDNIINKEEGDED